MSLIIDGYNLLNVSDIVGGGGSGSSLEQSRAALLSFLADRLTTEERRVTTVVFDARHAPPGLEPALDHHGITVRFARPHREADDLIEELIRADHAPRRLTVVSSDHRLHRAARRRKATPIDSDVWFRQFSRRAVQSDESVGVPEESDAILTSEELDEWLRTFAEPQPKPQRAPERPKKSPEPPHPDDLENPFPPGYGEDLLDGEDSA